MSAVTYLGLVNGRPRFSQAKEAEDANRGVMPKWLITAMDKKQIVVVGSKLMRGGQEIQVGSSLNA